MPRFSVLGEFVVLFVMQKLYQNAAAFSILKAFTAVTIFPPLFISQFLILNLQMRLDG